MVTLHVGFFIFIPNAVCNIEYVDTSKIHVCAFNKQGENVPGYARVTPLVVYTFIPPHI